MNNPDKFKGVEGTERVVSFAHAVHCLQQGGLVAYPTETFFAVGCRVGDAEALQRVYGAKQRPHGRPLPVLGGDWEHLFQVAHFDDVSLRLGQQFWPGPLTILLPAKDNVPDLVTAQTGRIGVRLSSHETACALALAVGAALVSSSANVSGQPPVCHARYLDARLVQGLDGVVDTGTMPLGGLPSTLVEIMGQGQLKVLRRGAVSCEQLTAKGWKIGEVLAS